MNSTFMYFNRITIKTYKLTIAYFGAIILVVSFLGLSSKFEFDNGTRETLQLRKSADTRGGYGGEIIKVTNLNPSGPGSFYDAVRSKGKRIVVFEVGGVIDLKGKLVNIRDPYLTIAGETAPSPGITLINGGVIITSHDIIVRHIRIRSGVSGRRENGLSDALSTSRAYNVIIDHCSLTWAIDENLSVSGPRFEGETPDDWRANTSHRITLSNNIIAEGLSQSVHRYGEHSKGTLIHDNVTDVLIVGNLYASNMDRNPYMKGGSSGVIVNNYISNPGKAAIRYMLSWKEWLFKEQQTGKWSIVGNVMELGDDSEDIALLDIKAGPAEIFVDDNIAFRKDGGKARVVSGDQSKIVNNKPIWFSDISVVAVNRVKEHVLSNVGARPWDRDEHDKRIISSARGGKGKIINSELEVGGYPEQDSTRSSFDIHEWDVSNADEIKRKVGSN